MAYLHFKQVGYLKKILIMTYPRTLTGAKVITVNGSEQNNKK